MAASFVPGAGGAPRVVLVVDDQDDLRAMWCLWLAVWGFATIEARDGADAVRQARTEGPSLVLMDLSMPAMDGLEAVRVFHERAETADIPVIGITGDGRFTD